MPHHSFVSSVLEWINHESTFIFWFIVLNLTSLGVVFVLFWGYWNVFFQELLAFSRNASLVFFFAVIADLIIYGLCRKLPAVLRVAKVFLLALSSVMFALDIFTLWHYKTPFNMIMLEIVSATNFREGSEFLASYLFDMRFLAFTAGVFLVLYILRKIYSLFQRHNTFLAVILILGTLTGGFGFLREYLMNFPKIDIIRNAFILSRIYYMASTFYVSQEAYNNMLKEELKDITITAERRKIPNVVFILGESTSRNHLHLYGYNLPTTPKLSTRKNIYVFTDTVSPHAHTNSVLKKLFTFCRYDSSNEWFTYTSLFRILKQAGYHVSWLSNQETPSGASPARLYSGQCDNYKFTENFKDQGDHGKAYDEELLSFLDETIKNEHAENFYVLHLLGTHVRYSKKYPPEYAKFTADDEGGYEGISHSQKKTRSEYDNAVLYNDFIVDEIIRRFEDKNAIVIYISDHGEEVYDTVNTAGHDEYAMNPNMIEIPFIIWTSDKFRETYPELEARIASSVNRPYMTDDMIDR